MHAIRVHEHGGPEVMLWQPVEVGTPGPGEVLLRHTAVGLNYIDVYFRTGLYKPPHLPFTPGMEATGVVEAVGPDVKYLKVGDRVAYSGGGPGAYCEYRVLKEDRLVPLPEEISDTTAAALMLKGLTAHYLLRKTYRVQPGDTILIHAAAGGVGTLMCQWAKHLGATVIGTVGSPEKAEYARAHGCDHPIDYTREDFVARVREITGGAGLPVVYDSVGQATFMRSLDCLRPRGLMVCFGQSSGPVEPFDIGILNTKGSLFLTRPTGAHYTPDRESLLAACAELFEMVTKHGMRVEIDQQLPLREAVQAHIALEARRTTGATVLLP